MKAITTINKSLSLVERKGIYYARVNLGSSKYSWKSLQIPISKKANQKKAEQAALIYAGEIANMKKHGQPVTQRTFGDVIAEYVKTRTAENAAGLTKTSTLRQIIRVSKFLVEYAGNKPITESATGN